MLFSIYCKVRKKATTWLAVLFLLSRVLFSSAQTCPDNIDFENGNLNNWTFYTGSCCPISANNNSGAVTNRHTLTSGTGVDPYGGFPVVCPIGGKYSFKIGNDNTGAEAERARYIFRIPKTASNYSISMSYAVVFQDPGHAAAEQPRFEFSATDSATKAAIGCGTYSFISSSSLPGFTKSSSGTGVYYKAWSTMSINLSKYAGKTVILDFASGDCSKGGHFGYGYFDLGCSAFQINGAICAGSKSITLTAPDGFSSYVWYDSALLNKVGTGQSITINTPKVKTKYKVIITPYSGYGCKDTLQTQVDNSALKIDSIARDTTICHGNKMRLWAKASDLTKYYPLTGVWRGKKAGILCNKCDVFTFTPTVSDTFYYAVNNNPGCKDSSKVIVNVIPQLQLLKDLNNIRICENQPFTLKIQCNFTNGTTVQWFKDTSQILAALNRDSIVFPKASYLNAGYYQAKIFNRCDTFYSKKIYVEVDTIIHIGLKALSTVLCENEPLKLKITATGTKPFVYSWKKSGKITTEISDSFYRKNAAYTDSATYTALAKGYCGTDSAKIKIVVNPLIKADFLVNKTPQCFNTQQFNFTANSALRWGTFTSNWNLGNGRTYKTQSVKFDSFSNGNFTIKLIVKTDKGCSDSISKNIVINPAPTAIITPNMLTSCFKEQKFTFTDNSSIAYSKKTAAWYLDKIYVGNAKTMIPATPLTDGDHLIFLRVVSEYGCSDSTIKNAVVYPSPVSKIISNDTHNCYRQKISFTDASKINSGSFRIFWSTINASAADTNKFYPAYSTDGIYWVANKVVSDIGCTDSTKLKVNVHPNPIAGFTVNDSIQCHKEENIVLTDQSTIKFNSTLQRIWKLNGVSLKDTTSQIQTTLLNPGKYFYKLKVISNFQCTDSMSKSVEIYHSPVSKISSSDTINCYLQNIVFKDASKIAAGKYAISWHTAGITAQDTNLFYPKYTANGIYWLWNKSTSDKGCTDSIKMRVVVNAKPIAVLDINQKNQCEKEQNYLFNDLGSIPDYSITKRIWKLNGQTLPDTTKILNLKGLPPSQKTVKIVLVSNRQCMDSTFEKIEIYPSPIAKCNIPVSSFCINEQAFVFNDVSQLAYGTYNTTWYFGDNSNQQGLKVNHLYSAFGNFNVRQVLLTDKNCTDSIQIKTTVYPAPQSAISVNNEGQCYSSQDFKLEDLTTIAYSKLSRTWSLDGVDQSDMGSKITFKNLAVGKHTVGIVSISEYGCKDANSVMLHVFPDPKAMYSITADEYCIHNQKFIFTDKSTLSAGKFNTDWDFADGQHSNKKIIQHFYNQIGKYTTKLIVTSDSNCKDSVAIKLLVRPNPTALFTITDSLLKYPLFTNLSVAADKYYWNFGNGIKRTVADQYPINDIIFDFNKQRHYPVSLKVTDAFGCADSTMLWVKYREPFIYIPNAIVTGETGVNKIFDISCFRCKSYSMKIYDRWGGLLFQSAEGEDNPTWNGTFKGEPVMSGVYVYVIEIVDFSGHRQQKSGGLTIMR